MSEEKKTKIAEAFNALSKVVKAQFGDVLNAPQTVEENFISVKTVEGVVVNLEGELSVGVKAAIVTPEGQSMPAPEGEHTLEDGTKILVKEGAIAAITPVVAEAETPIAPVAEEENFAAKFDNINQAVTALVTRIEALESKGNQTFASVEDVKSLKQATANIHAVLDGLISTPVAEATVKPEMFSASNKRAEKLKELSTLLNKK